MFGRGLTRLQPAYVEDVAEAISRVMRRAETPLTIFEFAGPLVYSYKEFFGAVAHQAGLTSRRCDEASCLRAGDNPHHRAVTKPIDFTSLNPPRNLVLPKHRVTLNPVCREQQNGHRRDRELWKLDSNFSYI